MFGRIKKKGNMLLDKINHFTFATKNLEKSIRFYSGILEFEVLATWQLGKMAPI
jgi:catechol 2,3-dioxygenase-like lactoylglutathione lyase family enzyme